MSDSDLSEDLLQFEQAAIKQAELGGVPTVDLGSAKRQLGPN